MRDRSSKRDKKRESHGACIMRCGRRVGYTVSEGL